MASGADDAFLQLNDAELAALAPLGVRRAVSTGEYLYREGDPGYDFYVVLAGAVEIVVHSDGKERVIARHSPGRFLGELNLLTGQRVFVSARVAEPGEVLAVPREALRRVIATNASLSDKILAAFLARRAILLTGASSAIRVIGSRFSPDSSRVREFLVRNRIPHDWLDPDADSDVERLLREFDIPPRDLPVVIVSGKVLRRPTPGTLADYLGLTVGTMLNGGYVLIVVLAGQDSARSCLRCSRSVGRRGRAQGSKTTWGSRLAFPEGISRSGLRFRPKSSAHRLVARARSHRCRRKRAISFFACPTVLRFRAVPSLSRPERATGGSTLSASNSSSRAACSTPRPSWRPERAQVHPR